MLLRRSLAAVSLLAAGCSASPEAEDAPGSANADPGRVTMLLFENKPEQAAREARAMLAKLPQPETYDEVTQVADLYLDLCEAETRLGEYDAAEGSCLEALDTFETKFGSFSRKAPLDAYEKLFEVYRNGRDDPTFMRAEIVARERYLERLPEQRVLTASRVETLVSLGDLHQELGNWQAAEDAYRHGFELSDDVMQLDRGIALEASRRLAAFNESLGRLREAEDTLKSGMNRMVSRHGADDFYAAGFYVTLAELYIRQFRWKDALPLAKRALPIYERAGQFRSHHSADALLLLAVLQPVTPDDTAEGKRQLGRALQLREERFGTDSLPYASALTKAALFYQVRQDYGEWERYARQSAQIVEAHFGPDHPETAEGYLHLAIALQLQGENAEALPYAEKAYDSLKAQSPRPGSSFRLTLELLIKVYGALGRDAKRRAVQEELNSFEDSQAELKLKAKLRVRST